MNGNLTNFFTHVCNGKDFLRVVDFYFNRTAAIFVLHAGLNDQSPHKTIRNEERNVFPQVEHRNDNPVASFEYASMRVYYICYNARVKSTDLPVIPQRSTKTQQMASYKHREKPVDFYDGTIPVITLLKFLFL